MLLALNQTVIDWFSLDVEGAEMSVLASIPFDKITIKVDWDILYSYILTFPLGTKFLLLIICLALSIMVLFI